MEMSQSDILSVTHVPKEAKVPSVHVPPSATLALILEYRVEILNRSTHATSSSEFTDIV